MGRTRGFGRIHVLEASTAAHPCERSSPAAKERASVKDNLASRAVSAKLLALEILWPLPRAKHRVQWHTLLHFCFWLLVYYHLAPKAYVFFAQVYEQLSHIVW